MILYSMYAQKLTSSQDSLQPRTKQKTGEYELKERKLTSIKHSVMQVIAGHSDQGTRSCSLMNLAISQRTLNCSKITDNQYSSQTLFLILRRIFFRFFSSCFVSGNLVGIG